ncbi:MAG: amidohydrolase [Rhodospirillaceae bacterium]|jgi:predicted amidohydrolase YtcJ|nr:amidohydrolase [Rhodospirillaceae bacterium]MBT7612857.1 amidohydrolase [Rhodospirillaceae bacterium]
MATQRRVLTGGRIFTADSENPWADAVVVDGEKIAFVGGADEALAIAGVDAEHIDAGGGLVMPGFVDGHVHVTLTGASMLKAYLRDAESVEDIQQLVRAWADKNPDAPRVLGTDWIHSVLPDNKPTKEILDAVVSDRPVYLDAFDFHSCWVNSAALRELGIDDDTPDPAGGTIARDPETGEATGHLLESAHFELVTPMLARVPDDVRDGYVSTALEAFARAGITTVVEMAMEEEALESLARKRDAGTLTTRVVAHMIIWRKGDLNEELALVKRAAELAEQYQGDWLRVGGVKIIGDGSIDACTAALSQPYVNGSSSDPIWTPEALDAVVEAADAAGLQVAVHAVGDLAIRNTVDAIEKAMQANGTSGRRHRIEHLEHAHEEDINRMGKLGITASMQPVHMDPAYLQNWIAMVGPERANNGFAWPLHVAAGSTLAFGTDAPTTPHWSLPNMYIATTRKSPVDDSLPALRPDWALPVEEAIVHGTRDSAWAAWLEHTTGVLKPGLAADIVVVDRDFFADGPDALLKANVVLTMMGGEIVYSH